jgi:hypothetical protein
MLFAAVSLNVDALAQPVSSEGVLSVYHWPDFDDRGVVRDLRNNNFFPSVDTLSVGYRYAVRDDRPGGEIMIEWIPGDRGIHRGAVARMQDIPARFRLIALDLVADVVVDGQVVDTLVLRIDSLSLDPVPGLARIDDPDIPWDQLFESRDAEKARSIVDRGFELSSLRVIRMAFSAERISNEEDGQRKTGAADAGTDPTEWETIVYVPDVQIWIDWTFGADPFHVPVVRTPTHGPYEPRGDLGRGPLTDSERGTSRRGSRRGEGANEPTDMMTVGRPSVDGESGGRGDVVAEAAGAVSRSGAGRTSRPDASASDGRSRTRTKERAQDSEAAPSRTSADRTKSGDRGSDRKGKKSGKSSGGGSESSGGSDDDDDEQLLPAALAGVAAVGVLAVMGGTIGYYGRGSDAPIGLSAGYVRPGSGILFQVAVNSAVFGRGNVPEQLFANVTYFQSVLRRFPLQPAVGLGVHAHEDADRIDTALTVSFGAAVNAGPIILLGMYDVVSSGVEFGLAVNFRAL